MKGFDYKNIHFTHLNCYAFISKKNYFFNATAIHFVFPFLDYINVKWCPMAVSRTIPDEGLSY
jgi:hypothetical protein